MGLCKDCEYWIQPDYRTDGWGICDLTGAADGEAYYSASSAVATAMHLSPCHLETRSHFGCVQFKARGREER